MCRIIRCVAFDFDGTLVDSNHIKRDAFHAVAATIPDGSQIMQDILSTSSPGDRYAVFDRFVDVIGLPAAHKLPLARQYGEYCEVRIAACPNTPGATAAMQELHAQHVLLFVNSATPEHVLRPIVQGRNFNSLLTGVFGGPASKADNLRRILSMTEMRPRELVVVGDGANDHEAAEEIGCHFVPVFDAPEEAVGLMPPLTDLALLPAAIASLSGTRGGGAFANPHAIPTSKNSS